ncbi:hypothetical protein WDW86_04085 [Bdellovibrionota bacterium FG-2]
MRNFKRIGFGFRGLALMIFLAFFQGGPVARAATSATGVGDFRLSHFSVLQTGAQSYAGFFSWDPLIRMGSSFGLRPEIGVGGEKQYSSSGDFDFVLLPTGSLLATVGLGDNFWLEAGPGYQFWVNAGNNGVLTLTGGALILFGSPFLKFIDGVSLDYSMAYLVNNRSHEIRAGISF